MTIILVKSEGGDLKHAEAIGKELQLNHINYIYADKDILNFCPADKIIIAVGASGLLALQNFEDFYPDAYIYWGAHQLTTDDKNILSIIAPHISNIALPEAIINSNKDFLYSKHFQQTKLIATISVPSLKLSYQELLTAYNELNFQYPAIDLEQDYIIVSLPGDAPNSNNQWQEFNKDSVKKLFDLTQHMWQEQTLQGNDAVILIENGPRTGRMLGFNHQYNKHIDDSVDDISKFFLSLLDENNIPNQFYPFAIKIDLNGKKLTTISAHNALIYAAIQTKAVFIVPGESTSQMSELSQYITDPNLIIVFSPSSQNEAHKSSMQQAYKAGCLSIWDENEVLYPLASDVQNCLSDISKVAAAISDHISEISISNEFFI